MGVLVIRALLSGVCIGSPDFRKLLNEGQENSTFNHGFEAWVKSLVWALV